MLVLDSYCCNMDILAAVLGLTLVYLFILNGVAESKLISNDQSQGDRVENDLSPLERKVDALTQVVDSLLVESKVKDLKILNLEKRVSELEKRPTEPNDIQETHKNQQPNAALNGSKKHSNSNNLNGHQIVHPTSQATKYRHAILKTNKVITFQQKTLDTANAYNSADGIYIVPESGIYVFTWTLTSYTHSRVTSELMINSNIVGKNIADSDENSDFHTSTGITVALVTKGDHVYIKFGVYLGGSVKTTKGHPTFSGWKLD